MMSKEIDLSLEIVARRLERGEVAYSKIDLTRDRTIGSEDHWRKPYGFNMNTWRSRRVCVVDGTPECGTVCCVGGLVEYVLGRPLSVAEARAYDPIFHPRLPDEDHRTWSEIQPSEAVVAIRRWLGGDLKPWS